MSTPMPTDMGRMSSAHRWACRVPAHTGDQRDVTAGAASAKQDKDVCVIMAKARMWLRAVAMAAAHLCAVKPQAAQAVEDLGLQEADPARVQLHDDGEGGVGREDDVVDHGCVVADPDVIGSVDWPWPMIPAGKLSE